MDDFLGTRYNKEKLEAVRDSLTLHLNELYAEEQTVDNYDKLKDLTEALEFCLEGIRNDLAMIEIAERYCELDVSVTTTMVDNVERLKECTILAGPVTPN